MSSAPAGFTSFWKAGSMSWPSMFLTDHMGAHHNLHDAQCRTIMLLCGYMLTQAYSELLQMFTTVMYVATTCLY